MTKSKFAHFCNYNCQVGLLNLINFTLNNIYFSNILFVEVSLDEATKVKVNKWDFF